MLEELTANGYGGIPCEGWGLERPILTIRLLMTDVQTAIAASKAGSASFSVLPPYVKEMTTDRDHAPSFTAHPSVLLFDLDGTLAVADSVYQHVLAVGLLTGGYPKEELFCPRAGRVYLDPANLAENLEGLGVHI